MPRNEPRPRVLIVDDMAEMGEMLKDGLHDRGFEAVAVHSSRQALSLLETATFDALVTDIRMPQVDGLELLAQSRALDPERPVILMTAYGAIDTAVEAIRQGAYHYLTKPFKTDELVIFLRRALEDLRVRREAATLRKALRDRFSPTGMLGKSKSMRDVFEMIDRVADTQAPVLILGETGTGKGLVATALHAHSQRSSAPMITINCAALPESLLESELFGHVRGAFTGAATSRAGLFCDASGGTLFLDEIGEMALPLQAKLLHVLERGVVRPVGGSKEVGVDVRIVAATHRDLRDNVRLGTFREDLLYRLDVVAIELPALRRHAEDIPELIEHFLSVSRARYPNSPVRRMSREALARMLDYAWPGNVRELAHIIERVVLLGRNEDVAAEELPVLLHQSATRNRMPFVGEVIPMRELQRMYVAWAFEQTDNNRTRTAEKLGIDYKTLGRWLSTEPDDPSKP